MLITLTTYLFVVEAIRCVSGVLGGVLRVDGVIIVIRVGKKDYKEGKFPDIHGDAADRCMS